MLKKQPSYLFSMLIIAVLMTTPILFVGAAPLSQDQSIFTNTQDFTNQFIDSDGDVPGGSSEGTYTLLEPTSHANDNNGVNNRIGDIVDIDFDSMTNQIIIQFAESSSNNRMDPSSTAQISRINTAAGITLTYVREMSGDLHVLRLPSRMPKTAVENVLERIAALPEVVYAEPDSIRRHTAASNDPLYSQQWHYFAPTSGNYGINLPPAWDLAHSLPKVVVAVVDTGITSHVEFVGQTVPGYDFIHDPREGNDGDGRDNDPSDPGDWVTSAESSSGYFQGCQVSDSSWHGTHVAGTIGARTNNSIGVAGINWNVKILPVRVLGKCGGYLSDMVDGMRWAAGLSVPGVPANPNPAKVLNLSLGGQGACSLTEQSAINAINATGATVVVAAGNSNTNASGFAPGNCNGVITVAATNRNGSRASYSNYGSIVDISAPGGDSLGRVYSTLDLGKRGPTGDTYGYMQGTSQAAPHVSGVVSLLYAANNSLTWNQVKQILQENVTPFPAGSTCNVSICGSGIVNAYLALETLGPFEQPPPPTGVSASDGAFTDKVQVSWSPSAGATTYQVFRHTSNNASSASSLTSSHPASPYNDTSAVPGTTYYYWVKACNSAGCSGFSASDSGYRAIEVKPPSPPLGVSASDGTFTDKIRVTWGRSASHDFLIFLPLISSGGSGPTPEAPYFQVYRNTTNSSAGAIKLVDHYPSNPYDDTSAVAGTTYYYWVKACNSAGCSGFSASDSGYRGVKITKPSSPTGVSASDGIYTDKVQVAWTASADATTYQVFRHTSDDSSWAIELTSNHPASPYNDTSAFAGTTYYYWVKACNSAGCSGFSTSDSGYRGVEITKPSAPTGVSASDGIYTDKVQVLWTASADATTYQVFRYTSNNSSGAIELTGNHPASPYNDTSAFAGTTYYYWVKACNSAGCSGFSASDSGYRAVEITTPAPPTGVSASKGTYTDKVQVAWMASADATTYQVFRYTSNDSSSATILTDDHPSSPYDDTSAIPGTTYYYWVKACNSAGCSGFSKSDSGFREEVSAGFNSQFDGHADGWVSHSGSWWISTENEVLWTEGIDGTSSSVSYTEDFDNFDYQVRLARLGSDTSANQIMVRGTPSPLQTGNRWYSGYYFQYNRNGRYSIFKSMPNGEWVFLQEWTTSSAINQGDYYNILRVVANGSDFSFYINGTLVWEGSDTFYSSGRVGIGMYRAASTGLTEQLIVDWAVLTTLGKSGASDSGLPDPILPDHQNIVDEMIIDRDKDLFLMP